MRPLGGFDNRVAGAAAWRAGPIKRALRMLIESLPGTSGPASRQFCFSNTRS
jgi:hypothetical protein